VYSFSAGCIVDVPLNGEHDIELFLVENIGGLKFGFIHPNGWFLPIFPIMTKKRL
jgi:hypothetical protein